MKGEIDMESNGVWPRWARIAMGFGILTTLSSFLYLLRQRGLEAWLAGLPEWVEVFALPLALVTVVPLGFIAGIAVWTIMSGVFGDIS